MSSAKQSLFKELGLDEHQWDVFSMTYDALKARLAEAEERLVAARYLIDGLLNVRDPFIRVKATEWLRAADSAGEKP